MMTGLFVWKMRFTPSSTSLPRAWNSGPRWSMVGRSIARKTRSGTLVGPGIWRKCRPAGMAVALLAEVFIHNAAAPPRLIRPPVKAPMTDKTPLAARLAREVDGEVRFDAATRGRYATDASIYQVMPVGVVVPRTADAAITAMQIAAEQQVAILPRGAGTSQCGQTVGEALVIDDSKHLDRLLDLDVGARRAVVEPGIVLDQLNAMLRPHGLWYPVDVSTSAQATLGGMAGNNSCGSRSLAYGNMVDRV